MSGQPENTSPSDAGIDQASFVGLLGLDLWFADDRSRGRSIIRPSMWIPDTRRPRVGVLATMLDMVGGNTADGPVTPTADLRLTMLADPPESGPVDLVCDIKKWGRTLLTSETLFSDGDGRVFARGTTTFLATLLEGVTLGSTPPPDADIDSFDALMAPTVVDSDALDLDMRAPLLNGVRGTVQGGVQTMFAEMVAEHAVAAGPLAVTDLDIRYLNGMKGGPLRGTATVLGDGSDGTLSVRVLLTDCAADHRLVSYVFMRARRIL